LRRIPQRSTLCINQIFCWFEIVFICTLQLILNQSVKILFVYTSQLLSHHRSYFTILCLCFSVIPFDKDAVSTQTAAFFPSAAAAEKRHKKSPFRFPERAIQTFYEVVLRDQILMVLHTLPCLKNPSYHRTFFKGMLAPALFLPNPAALNRV